MGFEVREKNEPVQGEKVGGVCVKIPLRCEEAH